MKKSARTERQLKRWNSRPEGQDLQETPSSRQWAFRSASCLSKKNWKLAFQQ